MDVPVYVDGQKVYLQTSNYIFAPGTSSFVRFWFHMSDDWDSYMTFAQWRQGDAAYSVYLDGNNTAYLPREIVHGECEMFLGGTNVNGQIAVTKPVRICIIEDRYLANDQNTELTSEQSEDGKALLVTKIPKANISYLSEAKNYLGL